MNEFEQEKQAVKLMFVGDLMLDRGMRTLLGKKGAEWLTKEIKHIFAGRDLVVANLEGTVSHRRSMSLGTAKGESGHCLFTFDPSQTKEVLEINKINVVCLGNNHAFNFKENGLGQTRNFLDRLGCEHFGAPYDSTKKVIYKQIKGTEIAFVNYSRFKSGLSVKETGEIIKKAKSKSSAVIIFAHWGKEYELRANKDQKEAAHHFVDCGADLIIGTHPHVVQQVEIYKNRAIFYSIGNFIFDQDFSENVRTRLAVDVNLLRDRMLIGMTVLYFEQDGRLEVAQGGKQGQLFERISKGRKSWELRF